MRNFFTKRLSVLALAASFGFALASCSNDEPIGPNDEPAPDGMSYISAKMFMGDEASAFRAGTRSLENGTTAEQKVSSMYMVLFNVSSGVTDDVAYCFNLGITGNGVDALVGGATGIEHYDPTSANVIVKAKQVATKNYHMLILVNPTTEILALCEVGDTWADFSAAYSTTPEGLTPAAGPFMSNAHDLFPIKPLTHLRATAAQAEYVAYQGLYVKVDRAVAKVIVIRDDALGNTLADGSTLVSATWSLINTAKRTYLMRNTGAPILTGALDPVAYEVTYLNRYSDASKITERDSLYALDPSWDYESGSGYVLADEITPMAFPATAYTNTFKVHDSGTDPDYSNMSYEYCLENTMVTADQPNKDLVTQMVLRAVITPAGYSSTDNYYTFRSSTSETLVFKRADITNWETGDYPDGALYIELSGAVTRAKAITPPAGAFPYDFTADPTVYVPRTDGIAFHYGQANFYTVPIRHFGTSNSVDRYGYYGVMRNNVYMITVTDIVGPGGGDSFISSYVRINPWYVRTQSGSVGSPL